jgi:uncharacterized phage protein (TIGR01671 family)
MRDIEFRGISTRTGNLVYGNYFHNFRKGEGFNIIPFDTNEWIEVVPETIGQYTGLKDKNGIKIFEGDVCCSGVVGYEKYKFEVIFEDGCFYYGSYLLGLDIEENCINSVTTERWCLVVGNVHQNKELLP